MHFCGLTVLINRYLAVDLFLSLSWALLRFPNLRIYAFYKLWKISRLHFTENCLPSIFCAREREGGLVGAQGRREHRQMKEIDLCIPSSMFHLMNQFAMKTQPPHSPATKSTNTASPLLWLQFTPLVFQFALAGQGSFHLVSSWFTLDPGGFLILASSSVHLKQYLLYVT